LARDVRKQTPDRGLGMWLGHVPLTDVDQGGQQGRKTGHDLIEKVRSNLAFCPPLAFAHRVAWVQKRLLL
jgi:hypothetical protein